MAFADALQVFNQVILPSTEGGKSAYVDLLSNDMCGPHDFYVVHAWGSPFSTTVKQVRCRGRRGKVKAKEEIPLTLLPAFSPLLPSPSPAGDPLDPISNSGLRNRGAAASGLRPRVHICVDRPFVSQEPRRRREPSPRQAASA